MYTSPDQQSYDSTVPRHSERNRTTMSVIEQYPYKWPVKECGTKYYAIRWEQTRGVWLDHSNSVEELLEKIRKFYVLEYPNSVCVVYRTKDSEPVCTEFGDEVLRKAIRHLRKELDL